jgi:hypothetical protein
VTKRNSSIFLISLIIAGLAIPALGENAGTVIVDNWPKPAGKQGVPDGWELSESKGSVAPGDIAVKSEQGRSVLVLKAEKKSYFIGKQNLQISLSKTPFLTWRWKTQAQLNGADSRKADTDDQPINLYVTFRAAKDGKVRAIGYIWDYGAPRCTYLSSPGERSAWKRTGLRLAGVPITWYVILSNRETPVDSWITETRDVAADYRKVFKTESVPDVGAIAVQVDTASMGGRAESWIGPIRFTSHPPAKPSGEKTGPSCKDLKPGL